MFFALKSPDFDGDESIELLDTHSFETLVRNPEGGARKVMWVIVFHADWCDECTRYDPMIADLSIRCVAARASRRAQRCCAAPSCRRAAPSRRAVAPRCRFAPRLCVAPRPSCRAVLRCATL